MRKVSARNWEMYRLRLDGYTYTKMADMYGLTPARVRQICIQASETMKMKRYYQTDEFKIDLKWLTLKNLRIVQEQLITILAP